MKEYEFFDHTADIGIKAFGNDLSEAFVNAAKAMFDIITDSSEIDCTGEYKIELEADDLEQLLVDWLSELLFLFSAYNIVFGEYKIDLNISHKKLSSVVCGEKFNTSKHKSGVEIKAVTYHMLEVCKDNPCFVKVLFDI